MGSVASAGELPDLPGPDLAAGLDLCEPGSRADDELIDRIGSWEKLRAWVDAGQLADIAELTARISRVAAGTRLDLAQDLTDRRVTVTPRERSALGLLSEPQAASGANPQRWLDEKRDE